MALRLTTWKPQLSQRRVAPLELSLSTFMADSDMPSAF